MLVLIAALAGAGGGLIAGALLHTWWARGDGFRPIEGEDAPLPPNPMDDELASLLWNDRWLNKRAGSITSHEMKAWADQIDIDGLGGV